MGDMADYVNDSSDLWDDRDYGTDSYQAPLSVDLASQSIWRCADGSTMPVSQMTDDHLLNSLRMIQRKGFGSPYTSVLMKECTRRGLKS